MIYNGDGTEVNPQWVPSNEFPTFMTENYPHIDSKLFADAEFGKARFVHGHAMYHLFAHTMQTHNLTFNEVAPFVYTPDDARSYKVQPSLQLICDRFKVDLHGVTDSMLQRFAGIRNMQTLHYLVWMNGVQKLDMQFLWDTVIRLRNPQKPVDYPDVDSLRNAIAVVTESGEASSVANLTAALTKAA